jgi:predicted phage terminase large subunit-like protein
VDDFPESMQTHVLGLKQVQRWRQRARAEQLPPAGDWRTWYIQAGRGAGKSRAGAEWLAEQEALHPPGSWAIVAPTFADGRATCVEETLLPILGRRVARGGWNRSLGEIFLRSGSRMYVDGADDGALRIQGKNLRGCWADEVGLWVKWDMAWNETLAFAVRFEPARIVATGTPKMGHGLVRQLVEDRSSVAITRMRTADNAENLTPEVIEHLYRQYGGTRLGTQELDGEWVAALEGDVLKRSWWRYYDKSFLQPLRNGRAQIGNAEIRFQWVLVSVDAPQKDKQSSDNVAIQVWGVDHANRYLLDARAEKLSYEQTKRQIMEMSRWARYNWRCQHRVLIENAGRGPELIVDLKRELGGIEKLPTNVEGSKGQRALAAAGDLETGNVYLPGRMRSDHSGPDERVCPAFTISLIEEAALFQLDGSHDSHDDQVDAWAQCMNWLRSRQHPKARTFSPFVRR